MPQHDDSPHLRRYLVEFFHVISLNALFRNLQHRAPSGVSRR